MKQRILSLVEFINENADVLNHIKTLEDLELYFKKNKKEIINGDKTQAKSKMFLF